LRACGNKPARAASERSSNGWEAPLFRPAAGGTAASTESRGARLVRVTAAGRGTAGRRGVRVGRGRAGPRIITIAACGAAGRHPSGLCARAPRQPAGRPSGPRPRPRLFLGSRCLPPPSPPPRPPAASHRPTNVSNWLPPAFSCAGPWRRVAATAAPCCPVGSAPPLRAPVTVLAREHSTVFARSQLASGSGGAAWKSGARGRSGGGLDLARVVRGAPRGSA